ncbi:Uncharacterised protein [uncultured archaeon]|nr:Uncharacterised protein [uncultured archaeon]
MEKKSNRKPEFVNNHRIFRLIEKHASGDRNPFLRSVLEEHFGNIPHKEAKLLLKKLRKLNYTPSFSVRFLDLRSKPEVEITTQILSLGYPESKMVANKNELRSLLLEHFSKFSDNSKILLDKLKNLK